MTDDLKQLVTRLRKQVARGVINERQAIEALIAATYPHFATNEDTLIAEATRLIREGN